MSTPVDAVREGGRRSRSRSRSRSRRRWAWLVAAVVLVIASVAAGDLVWPRSANAATVARTATFGPGKFGPLVVPSNLVEIRFDARGGSGGAGDGGNPCCR